MLKTNHGKKLLSKVLAASILVSALAFTACKNEKKLTASSTLNTAESSDKVPAKLKKISEETKSYLADKNIVVVLGYGYNDEENVTKITQNLNENFGVETEDKKALITVLVYPADFMVAGKERISSLTDRIEDKNLAGMIVLGAPEGLHIALSKIQDKTKTAKYIIQCSHSFHRMMFWARNQHLISSWIMPTKQIQSKAKSQILFQILTLQTFLRIHFLKCLSCGNR